MVPKTLKGRRPRYFAQDVLDGQRSNKVPMYQGTTLVAVMGVPLLRDPSQSRERGVLFQLLQEVLGSIHCISWAVFLGLSSLVTQTPQLGGR